MRGFGRGRQLALDLVSLLLRQIDRRSSANHCRRLPLSIVNHPTLRPLENQKSGWRRWFIAHLLCRPNALSQMYGMQVDVIVDEKRAGITLRLRARRCRPKLCQDDPETKLEVLHLLKGDVALLSGRKPSYPVE